MSSSPKKPFSSFNRFDTFHLLSAGQLKANQPEKVEQHFFSILEFIKYREKCLGPPPRLGLFSCPTRSQRYGLAESQGLIHLSASNPRKDPDLGSHPTDGFGQLLGVRGLRLGNFSRKGCRPHDFSLFISHVDHQILVRPDIEDYCVCSGLPLYRA